MLRAWVDGAAAECLPLRDRGFAYGDGLFETILVDADRPIWMDAHIARLERGCAALGLRAPPRALLLDEVAAFLAGAGRAVLRLVVTRGDGGRGYAPDPGAEPRRVLMLYPFAAPEANHVTHGVALRWCHTPLATHPRLAGIKHLNRLEQVLARAEWSDAYVPEGLQCDDLGQVVCGTVSNLFLRRGPRWFTPRLDRCGVAGTCRSWVQRHLGAQETTLRREAVEGADALFLTSSLRGILPVARLGGLNWSPDVMTRELQDLLWREVPALRPEGGRA